MPNTELDWWEAQTKEKRKQDGECRPHLLLTLAERSYLGHCESTTQQQQQLYKITAAEVPLAPVVRVEPQSPSPEPLSKKFSFSSIPDAEKRKIYVKQKNSKSSQMKF